MDEAKKNMNFLSCGGELNHHGKYVCDCMYQLLGENYKRVTTRTVNAERRDLGYKDLGDGVPYNIPMVNSQMEEIRRIISWCDVMDYGAAPEVYLNEAVRQGKIVFIRIERLFKEGWWKILAPHIMLKYYRKYIRYKNCPNVFFLCVSAYAADDLRKIGIKNDRILQWAYCPEFIRYDNVCQMNEQGKLNLLWVGRLIKYKRPEIAVQIAYELKKRGFSFALKIAGEGKREKKIARMISRKKLNDEVQMLGAVPVANMRELMREADLLLATSNRQEGWGVVINEGMNSGCAVIASQEMGATPVLIEDGKNGFVFHRGNVQEAMDKIERLYLEKDLLPEIKKNAYHTIENEFSPMKYAETFLYIAECAMNGKQIENVGKFGGRAK